MSIISRPSRRGLSPLAGNAIRRLKSGRHSASRCGFALRLPRVHHSPAQCQLSEVRCQFSIVRRLGIKSSGQLALRDQFSKFSFQLSVFSFRGTINQCFASATSYLLLHPFRPPLWRPRTTFPSVQRWTFPQWVQVSLLSATSICAKLFASVVRPVTNSLAVAGQRTRIRITIGPVGIFTERVSIIARPLPESIHDPRLRRIVGRHLQPHPISHG